MNTPVSFELAKLLKAIDFKDGTLNYYFEDGELREYKITGTNGYYGEEYSVCHDEFMNNWNDNFLTKKNGDRCFGCSKSSGYLETFSAPTITEVVMWLYEKYGVWVNVSHQRHSEGKHWSYNIKLSNGFKTILWENSSPAEAYIEAIKYCLTKLL